MTEKLLKQNGKKRGNTRKKAFKRTVNTQKRQNRRKGKQTRNKRKQVGGSRQPRQPRQPAQTAQTARRARRARKNVYAEPIPKDKRITDEIIKEFLEEKVQYHRKKKGKFGFGKSTNNKNNLTQSDSYRTAYAIQSSFERVGKLEGKVDNIESSFKRVDQLEDEVKEIKSSVDEQRVMFEEIKGSDELKENSVKSIEEKISQMEYLMNIPSQKITECEKAISILANEGISKVNLMNEKKKIIEDKCKIDLTQFADTETPDQRINLGEYIIIPYKLDNDFTNSTKAIEKHSVLFSRNLTRIQKIVSSELKKENLPLFNVQETSKKIFVNGVKKLKFLFVLEKIEDLFNYQSSAEPMGRQSMSQNADTMREYIAPRNGLPIIKDGNFLQHLLKILTENTIEITDTFDITKIPDDISLLVQCIDGRSLSGIFVVLSSLLIFIKNRENRDMDKCRRLISDLMEKSELKFYFEKEKYTKMGKNGFFAEDLGQSFCLNFAQYLIENIDGNNLSISNDEVIYENVNGNVENILEGARPAVPVKEPFIYADLDIGVSSNQGIVTDPSASSKAHVDSVEYTTVRPGGRATPPRASATNRANDEGKDEFEGFGPSDGDMAF